MVDQKQVKAALRELGNRGTIKEIVGMLYLKKIVAEEYSVETGSRVSRVLNALRGWGDVDRIMHCQANHPKTTLQDIWFIVEQKI